MLYLFSIIYQASYQVVIVPAENSSNNIQIVFKKLLIECLIMELGIDNSIDSPTYIPIKLIIEEILDKSQISFMFFMRL